MRHILRHLAATPTAELDARAVDEFRAKLRRARLAPRSVNMILDMLAQPLDDAVDYKLLPANPARGPRRREKVPKAARTFLEPDMVVDLLDVAGEWERQLPAHQRYGRRAFLAALCLAGPRISELTDADRAGLDIHGGALRLGKKTAAGTDRYLEVSAFLVAELRAHLAAVPAGLRDQRGAALPLFPTRTGGRLNPSNIRNRLLTGTPARTDPRTGRQRAAIERTRSAPARGGCCCCRG
jgi:integrase